MRISSSQSSGGEKSVFHTVQQIEATAGGRGDAVEQIAGNTGLREQVEREKAAKADQINPERQEKIAQAAAARSWKDL